MKSILFLSGKGGTGKTSLASAFAVLSENKVLADCDVDAANLHLLLNPEVTEKGEFQGSGEAVKDNAKCTNCGECRRVCRFHAIDEQFNIDPYLCEGCGACVYVCPTDAITLRPRISGQWYTASTDHGPLASAELYPGEETSGKLVTLVKQKAHSLVKEVQAERLVIDGSPGIGCPVIASATGASAVILVTEPSLSGLHDLERILGVVTHFRIPAYLVVNKFDLNEEMTTQVEAFAKERELQMLGCIPYDPAVPRQMIEGKSVVEDEQSPAGTAMREIYARFEKALR
ncbi:MAG: ATP-binding protein [Candidatus Bipolaricaulota bacterium]|nr:ATP-binding protein [Candidatus Bipolaricaulota bacterium]